jgi:hypothetical protein
MNDCIVPFGSGENLVVGEIEDKSQMPLPQLFPIDATCSHVAPNDHLSLT